MVLVLELPFTFHLSPFTALLLAPAFAELENPDRDFSGCVQELF